MPNRKVAVVGVYQTHHEARKNATAGEMVYEATTGVLRGLGITRDKIDTVIESSSDYWDGAGCSNIATVDAAGANLKEESKVEDDSIVALIYAYMRILSGKFETALVVSHTKCSEVPSLSTLSSLNSEPIYQRPIGLNEISAAALQAQLLLTQGRIDLDHMAGVSVKNLVNALRNDKANRKLKLTADDVKESNLVAHPLRTLHCSVGCDGACAVVLAADKVAHELTDKPVWMRGIGFATDEYYLSDRDPLEQYALQVAAKQAYKASGIKNPSREIDVAEVCEPFAHQELILYEKLGLCPTGKAGRLIDEGTTEIQGELPVNPSGGVLSTDPYVARGLLRVIEATLQLRGEAGKHQVRNCKTALAHSTSGLSGQSHNVIILGGKVG